VGLENWQDNRDFVRGDLFYVLFDPVELDVQG
jgi:hypothetical protein